MRRNKLDKRQRWLARNNFFPCSCKNCKPRNVVRRMKNEASSFGQITIAYGEDVACLRNDWENIGNDFKKVYGYVAQYLKK